LALLLFLTNGALLINFLGCFDDRKAFLSLLMEFLNNVTGDICYTCKMRKETNVMRIFDCKNPECQKLYENAPRIIDNLCSSCASEWQQLQDELSMLSVSFAIDTKLVRGLDYYCKTVFEFVSGNLGAQSSICGGGRYDQLVSQLGGNQDQPSIGVGIGVERLLMLLGPNRASLPIEQPPALHLILPMTVEQHPLALLIADALQRHGLCADILLEGDSLKSMMRKANKLGAQYCLIVGPDEQERKTVALKNMVSGKSEVVLQADIVSNLLG
jgi:histidyl-tRNA synthetase